MQMMFPFKSPFHAGISEAFVSFPWFSTCSVPHPGAPVGTSSHPAGPPATSPPAAPAIGAAAAAGAAAAEAAARQPGASAREIPSH